MQTQAHKNLSFEAYQVLANSYGIAFPEVVGMARINEHDGKIAMDAQPSLITSSNAGIPAFLTTYMDPKLVQVLVTPNKAAEIFGEERKGDWLTETAMFPMVESTGETSSYGDYSENGRSGANVQFENRQSYLYQVFTEWGERELERMGLAKVDWATRLNIASALTLDKFQNNSYFYGIAGLQNYGLLNDPSLSAALVPMTKAATGTGWKLALPTEIVSDVQAMYAQLVTQTGGNVEMDSEMVLALHPVTEVYLKNTNSFGLSALGILNTIFKNLRVVSAVQYLSGTTYSAQLIVKAVQGQGTGYCAFNEKLREHPPVRQLSSWQQKVTSGTWGAVIKYPMAITTITGI